MATYPYTSNPARAKDFFQKIQDLGVPQKVTFKYLESLGYKGKNDRAILTVLRGLGFVDASGTPTDTWKKFRNKGIARAVMASALRENYSALFTTYPDAYRRDNEALRNFFSTHTDVGEGGLRFIVGTFKAMTELGDFGADPIEIAPADQAAAAARAPDPGGGAVRTVTVPRQGGNGVVLNINIQLQIPETEKAEVYDRFFEAMKRHLLS
jgi:hypothetical protein